MKRAFPITLLLLSIASLLALGLNTSPAVASGHIYIRANGSIDPSSAHISSSDNITYVFTSNINDSIIIERSNVIVDGSGYTLHGLGTGNGFYWVGVNNVTIKSVNIENFVTGILVSGSSFCTICGNNVTENSIGIWFSRSLSDTVFGNNVNANIYDGITFQLSNYSSIFENNVADNGQSGIKLDDYCNQDSVFENSMTNNSYCGIELVFSSYNNVSDNFVAGPSPRGISCYYNANNNIVSGNNVTGNAMGVSFCAWSPYVCSNNTLVGNNIFGNSQGICLSCAAQNTIARNNIAGNSFGIDSDQNTSLNSIFHNSFINNTHCVYNWNSTNVWDDGYPEGGNFWGDYTSRTDDFRGVGQNITGSDGIADSGYTLPYTSGRDRYPLMGSFGSQTVKGTNVTVFPEDKVCLILKNVTGSGSTTVNKTASGLPPLPDYVLVGSAYDIKVSATFSGNVMVRIIYNDSGLTLEQEMGLRLSQWNATGDVDFSGKVDLKDVFAVGRAFGSILVNGAFWHEPTRSCCPHSANADLNGDGKVDLKDYYRTCKQFGKVAAWVNITTYVDTENNVIYGETDHFSGIGVHRLM